MQEFPSAPIIHSYLYSPTKSETKYNEVMKRKNCFERLL